MKVICIINIFVLLILISCANNNKTINILSENKLEINKNYADQLAYFGNFFLNTDGIQKINLSKESISYLEKIYLRIISSNEHLFEKKNSPKFYIIKSNSPFIFSLPNSQFFISQSLLKHYLKSEDLFIAALAFEILKSERNLYEKKKLIPLGFCSLEKILNLVKVDNEIKNHINEWSYVVLKRSGYNASAYLNWIQVQNRNILDFSFYLGDVVSISKEEFSFKNFIAHQGLNDSDKKNLESNSSKEFYKILTEIERF